MAGQDLNNSKNEESKQEDLPDQSTPDCQVYQSSDYDNISYTVSGGMYLFFQIFFLFRHSLNYQSFRRDNGGAFKCS